MRFVGELARCIEDEARGAAAYAKEAQRLKSEGKSNASQLFAEMARQEANHADKLHELALKEVAAARASGAEVPAGMAEIWEWRHGCLLDEMARARELLAML